MLIFYLCFPVFGQSLLAVSLQIWIVMLTCCTAVVELRAYCKLARHFSSEPLPQPHRCPLTCSPAQAHMYLNVVQHRISNAHKGLLCFVLFGISVHLLSMNYIDDWIKSQCQKVGWSILPAVRHSISSTFKMNKL